MKFHKPESQDVRLSTARFPTKILQKLRRHYGLFFELELTG